MGSFKSVEKSEVGGRTPGKIDASLNEKLQNVEWGEYKISELFKPQKITNMLSKDDLSDKFRFPAYSSESTNNGIIGYTNSPEFVCDNEHPVFVTFGDHTRAFNIAAKSFSVLDNVKVLLPIINNIRCLLWIITVWKKQIPNLGYARHWKIAKNCTIKLPVQNGKIDFDFMESFIAELEAYLTVSGFDNYELSIQEQSALEELENLEFKEYNVTEIFHVKNTFNILSSDVVKNSGDIPYLCASSENNGVSTYINYHEQFRENGNCIFIGGKTFVVSYQEKDFYSNDSHNLALYLKEDYRTKLTQLYLATCVNKSLCHKYSWGDSVSKAKINKDKILLPTKDGKPYYEIMENFISAIQKLVIKDVVLYADKKLSTAKTVIKNNQT